MDISIVIPVLNEEENLEALVREIEASVSGLGREYEMLFIDDGSTDDSLAVLERLAGENERVRAIVFRRNFGQSAAMDAGFRHARGKIVITMDADLQNDPADIPALLAELERGHDVVSGWRKNRKDAFFSRVAPSRMANWIIRKVTGVTTHDFGCTLRAYRSEIVRDIRLYGEMHRFLPALAQWQGARLSEIEVHHRPRLKGRSKYGIGRTFKVLIDLLTVTFLSRYSGSPGYFFGKAGLLMFSFSFLTLLYSVWKRVFQDTKFHRTPLPIIAMGFALVGIFFLFQGLLAELMVRIYYSSENRPMYAIRKVIGKIPE